MQEDIKRLVERVNSVAKLMELIKNSRSNKFVGFKRIN